MSDRTFNFSKNSKLKTYDKKDFYQNWEKVNKNLGERWDSVVKNSPHKELVGKTLTDEYFIQGITRQLKQFLPRKKGAKLLKYDLYNEATGTAEISHWLLKQGYDLYGVDISKEVVRLAKKNFTKIINTGHFKVGDIRKLPFKSNSFDVVFSFGTIEHIRENEKSCAEAFRVLKPGGFFITGINNKLDLWGSYLVNEATNRVFKDITSYEPSYFPWEQRGWLKNVGFEKVKTTGMLMFPHLIRYGDLFINWKFGSKTILTIWNNLMIKPFIALATLLDGFDPIRIFGIHTTSMGYKPKKLK